MVMKRKAQECVGKSFGRLTVQSVRWETKNAQTVAWALCVCECQTQLEVRVSNLKNGTTKSCGCLRLETSTARVGMMIAANVSNGTIREPRMGSAAKIWRCSHYNDGDLSLNEFVELSRQNCFYCGAEPSNCANAYINQKFYSPIRIKEGNFIYNGLDRIDSSKPHNKNNVVPCCWNCNKSKDTTSKEDFFKWIEKVYNYSIKKMGL